MFLYYLLSKNVYSQKPGGSFENLEKVCQKHFATLYLIFSLKHLFTKYCLSATLFLI